MVCHTPLNFDGFLFVYQTPWYHLPKVMLLRPLVFLIAPFIEQLRSISKSLFNRILFSYLVNFITLHLFEYSTVHADCSWIKILQNIWKLFVLIIPSLGLMDFVYIHKRKKKWNRENKSSKFQIFLILYAYEEYDDDEEDEDEIGGESWQVHLGSCIAFFIPMSSFEQNTQNRPRNVWSLSSLESSSESSSLVMPVSSIPIVSSASTLPSL